MAARALVVCERQNVILPHLPSRSDAIVTIDHQRGFPEQDASIHSRCAVFPNVGHSTA